MMNENKKKRKLVFLFKFFICSSYFFSERIIKLFMKYKNIPLSIVIAFTEGLKG